MVASCRWSLQPEKCSTVSFPSRVPLKIYSIAQDQFVDVQYLHETHPVYLGTFSYLIEGNTLIEGNSENV